ncbi:Phytanoyl-CoA dioxygenase domain-containing protein 1-like protein [Yarrowia sp. B02]|nr:Phytanoyl-CoA dioxygenase domain-containing protein 1-like protein [Yarrowia sp. B02]
MLTAQQIEQFHKDGCIVVPGELSPETVSSLLQESHKLLSEFSLEGHPMTKFSTGDSLGEGEAKHVGDAYFLESSDKVRFFFEEGAVKDGKLTVPKEKAVNKIGHALHDLNPEFHKMSVTARNREIAASLGLSDPKILQSMLIFKQPEIGGKVPSHQDGTFLYTKPQSAVGFWYALEDCSTQNGTLAFVPGSHKTHPVAKRFVRDGHGGTTFEDVEGLVSGPEPAEENFKVLDIPAGSLVLIHNSVLHKSEANVSQKSRFAYTFHAIDGTCEYDQRNWLQVPTTGGDNFTRL